MIIPEGSKIVIYDKSLSATYENIRAEADMKIHDNSIMLLQGYLCCTDNDCVKKIDENVYQINVYCQDALCVRGGVLYESITDMY